MTNPNQLGGIIHTYQKYDPATIPSPTQPPPDFVSPAFEHMLEYGSLDGLTDEQLANAIKIDPSQIQGLGPSLDALRAMLEERKRKILERYETAAVEAAASKRFTQKAAELTPPNAIKKRYDQAVRTEQIRDLENLYYDVAGPDGKAFARKLVPLVQTLADKYQIDELASKYTFTGRETLTIPRALEIKEELETLDKLLQQLEDAKKNAQIGIIDLEELQEFADQADVDALRQLQKQVEEYIKNKAREQGLEGDPRQGFQLTTRAYRLFQAKVLSQIFSDLKASRTGRHTDAVVGDGATESPLTKEYEFGDSVTHMDMPASFTNALLRSGPGLPVRLIPDDIVIHKTKNNPKAATCVLLDMSGSMRHGLYINVKRMGLALDGLIRSEYPGDFLQFVEMYTFAKSRPVAEVAALMPKPVTIYNPIVRLRADMSDPQISEYQVPHHFTNIQHALQTARRYLGNQPTPNRQVMLITDGLPTAHFEGSELYMLYPPDPRTEAATMREAKLCAKEGITINIFLLSNWNQSREDIHFAYRMAETTKGRVIFTTGKELDRYVVWDYIKRRKLMIS